MTADWLFPKLGGGEESGLNDSGIETFKSPGSLARETVQNIDDARSELAIKAGKPAVASFELLQMPVQVFPGLDRFRRILQACKSHIDGRFSNPKDRERNGLPFFTQALGMIDKPSIPVLRIRDENTTGLWGGDVDRNAPYYRLLRGQGYSCHEGVAGGTYGIGQRAPFAVSKLRTVIYSTKTDKPGHEGDVLIAKSILCSFPWPDDKELTQSKGWYCLPSTNRQDWKAIRETAQIPDFFRRTSVGTDLYVTGYLQSDWERHVKRSILANFFAAIDKGLLEVNVVSGGKTELITSGNIETKVIEAADWAVKNREVTGESRDSITKDIGSTLHFLKALRNPAGGKPATRTIKNLGEVKLFVHRDQEATKRIAFMRQPRIVVKTEGSDLISGFAAVFLCESDEGNDFLADMENPEHNRWEPSEAKQWSEEKKREGSKVLREIRAFWKDELKKLQQENQAEVQDVPDLSRYLPAEDDDESPTTGTGMLPTEEATTTESAREIGAENEKVVVITQTPSVAKPRIPKPGDGPGTGGGKGGRGHGGGKGGGNGKTTGKAGGLSANEVLFRSFVDRGKPGGYRVVLTGLEDCEGDLALRAVGEDGKYDLSINQATEISTGASYLTVGSRIKGLKVAKGQHLELSLTVPSKVALSLSMVQL